MHFENKTCLIAEDIFALMKDPFFQLLPSAIPVQASALHENVLWMPICLSNLVMLWVGYITIPSKDSGHHLLARCLQHVICTIY